MAISRGKYLTQAPSPNNIRVNVPKFTAFDSAINVMSEINKSNETKDLVDYQRALDVETTKQSELKTKNDLLAKEQTSYNKQINQIHENSFTSAIILLEDKVFDLETKYPSDPSQILLELEEFKKGLYESENIDWLNDKQRYLKFEQKYANVRNSSLRTANKNYLTKLEQNTWDGINLLNEHLQKRTFTNIANIDGYDDLATFTLSSLDDFSLLNDRIGNYVFSLGSNSDKTELDLLNIKQDYIFNRDKNFISHVLTNLVMQEGNPKSIDLANILKDAWVQNKLPEKSTELDLLLKANGISKQDKNDLFQIMSDNTAGDDLNVDLTEKVIEHVDNAIKLKENEWIQNNKLLNGKIITESKYLEEQANKGLNNVNTPLLKREELEEIFVTIDDNNNIVSNIEAIEEFEIKQESKIQLSILLNDALANNLSLDEISSRLGTINFKDLGYENEDVFYVLKDQLVKQGFGGASPEELFENVMNQGVYQPDNQMELAILVMKQTNFIPKELSNYLEGAKDFKFEDEGSMKYLVGLAHVKNKAFGKTIPMNMTEEQSEALDEVYNTYKATGNYAEASKAWKLNTSSKDKILRENISDFKSWYYGSASMDGKFFKDKVNGYHHMENEITDHFNELLEKNDFTSLEKYTGLFSSVLFGTEYKDESLMETKGTFQLLTTWRKWLTFGLWNKGAYKTNATVSASVKDWMENYVNDNIYKYLEGENLKNSDHLRAYKKVFNDGLAEMKNTNFSFSRLLHNGSSEGNMVLTENNPQKIIGNGMLSENIIAQNVNAFIALKMFKETDINTATQMIFNRPANKVTEKEWADWKRDYMSLAANGKIRIKPVRENQDINNPSWNIFIDNDDDGLYTLVTHNGEPLEWFGNSQFTDSTIGYSKNETVDKWVDMVLSGQSKIRLGGEEFEIKLPKIVEQIVKNAEGLTTKDKTQLKNIIRSELLDQDSSVFRSIFADKSTIDTITEIQSILTSSFDDFSTQVQETLDFNFDNNQEAMVLNHKVKYDKTLVNIKTEEEKFQLAKNKLEKTTNDYKKIYGTYESGFIIPPNYKFVITDIMESFPNNWKELVGTESSFYKDMMNRDFRFAQNKIIRMRPIFEESNQLARYNDLLNLWNLSTNKIK